MKDGIDTNPHLQVEVLEARNEALSAENAGFKRCLEMTDAERDFACDLLKEKNIEIEALSTQNAAKDKRIAELEAGLRKCGFQFCFYADEHRKAGKTEKVATNQQFADMARALLENRNG